MCAYIHSLFSLFGFLIFSVFATSFLPSIQIQKEACIVVKGPFQNDDPTALPFLCTYRINVHPYRPHLTYYM